MITADRRDDVVVLTLDRHERRNALDLDHAGGLLAALGDAVGAGARAAVVTGAGTSFCSGADLGGVYGDAFRAALADLLRGLAAAPVPVIAAVNGPAVGAGAQIAVACDLRVVAPTASFAVPTARNGLAVDPWTVRRLAAVAGGGAARALLVGVETLSAERALAVGLADRTGDLDAAVAWAAELATLAPLSLRYAKLALDLAGGGEAATEAEVDAAFDACWASEDLAEYRTARAEKRPPVYRGR